MLGKRSSSPQSNSDYALHMLVQGQGYKDIPKCDAAL